MHAEAPASIRFEIGTPLPPSEGRQALLSMGWGDVDAGPFGAVHVPLPLDGLGPSPSSELLTTADEVSTAVAGGFRLARTRGFLAGARAWDGEDAEHGTRVAYRELLELVEEQRFHLLRVWNVLPRLHEGPRDLDRYMRFCVGRARAFDDVLGPGFERRLCAMSAVGCDRGPQVLCFLAGREPGRPLESPRQVSAYRYPPRYGPRSPSFARAIATPHGTFVSGTASIVGHESVHVGDVAAQTRETLTNLEALTGVAGGGLRAARVYLRHPRDHETVQAILRERTPACHAQFARAEICRPELLVEIEGVADGSDALEGGA